MPGGGADGGGPLGEDGGGEYDGGSGAGDDAAGVLALRPAAFGAAAGHVLVRA